nr:ROK family protein [Kordiimonas marina]
MGAIEAGGTKFICAVGEDAGSILERVSLPTITPAETLAACLAFFQGAAAEHGPISKLGIAAFGPLDLTPTSPTYGHLLETPKPGWSGTDLAGYFAGHLNVPVALDTDVNGAVLAEHKGGAAKACQTAVYITVGTGIGGGVLVNGRLLHGLIHPEIGHIAVPRAPGDEGFKSHCPYHADCLEGLASGPAMKARWGQAAETLPEGHEGWEMEAFYLAQLCRTLTVTLSPEVIILGGGVLMREGLLEKVRVRFDALMGGYLPLAARAGGLDRYIVRQSFGGQSGLVGAFALAEDAA